MLKIAILIVLGTVAAYAFNAFAQLRAEVRPPPAAIVSSSSNGVSFAWFYDANERTVIACRMGQGAGDTLDCKAKSALP
jgi:hypothetical protein